jgi:integrase
MKKRGLADTTIRNRSYNLKKLIDLGADLTNPESVETILATENLGKPYKKALASAYKAYAEYKGIIWKEPKITVTQKEIFLPTDEEVKQLIAGAGKSTRTLLQLLYETGARIGEASQIKWTDIDFKSKTVAINHAEKGSNNRTLPISEQLIVMINAMKKREDNLIFNPSIKTLYSTFDKSRRRVAKELNNPRLRKIHFHTLRHLKATAEYQ